MATEIASRLWRRRYLVDDLGVSESDWDGSLLRFIAWDELVRIDGPGILCSSSGERIRPKLEYGKSGCFLGTVISEWKSRAPDAWRENKARRFRHCRRSAFIILPLMFAVLLLTCYLLPWAVEGQRPTPAELEKLKGMAIMAVLSVGGYWFLYFKWWRRVFTDA